MSKQKNSNIGHIECFSCGELAAVRKNKNGALYYDCLECGRSPMNHAGGQRRIQERAQIWGAAGAPASVPEWIRANWPYAVAIRMRDKAKQGDAGKATAPGQPKVSPEPAAVEAAGASPDPDDLPAAPQPPRKRAPKPPKENPAERDPVDEPPPGRGIIGEAWDEL